MDTPDVSSHGAAKYTDTPGKYYVIYACLLVLAGLQFFIATLHLDTSAMFGRMLLVAVVEATLAVMFFMHLWAEKRSWFMFVVVFTVFVMLAMQYGWTDSNRMERGVPNAQTQVGAVR